MSILECCFRKKVCYVLPLTRKMVQNIFVIEKGLVAPTNPFSITNIHGPFYESEEGHVDASFENNTLSIE